MNASYARVIIDRSIHRELDYSIPETFQDRVVIGSRVRVPFREQSALGTVVDLPEESSAEGIKPIQALVGDRPALSEKLVGGPTQSQLRPEPACTRTSSEDRRAGRKLQACFDPRNKSEGRRAQHGGGRVRPARVGPSAPRPAARLRRASSLDR